MRPAYSRPHRLRLTPLVLVTGMLAGGLTPASVGAAPEATAVDANETDRFSGIIQSVNVTDGSLGVRNFWSTKHFDLGRNCRISLADKTEATATDLAPGQQVQIRYVKHDGVRVASEVAQEDQTFTGFVSKIDATNQTFHVERDWSARTFEVGKDCQLILRDGSKHPFAKLELGRRVTVTYLQPGSREVAQVIAERSLEFSGRVDSIDARGQTVGAKTLLTRHNFRIGDDCQFVIDGQLRGGLKDLRIGESARFNYEDIDGVQVVNRIELRTAPPTQQAQPGTASQAPPRQDSPES